MSAMLIEAEGGWRIHVFRQVYWLPWVAVATRENDGRIEGFNVEGATEEQALCRAKERINAMRGR